MTQESVSPLSQAKELLAQSSGRTTQSRLAVLSTLIQQHTALSHADMRKLLPTLDRVSIYRNLDWLTEEGLIDRIMGVDGLRRFAFRHHSAHNHPHFQCVDCGETSCLPSVDFQAPTLPAGYQFNDVSIIVAGTCADCSKSTASADKG